ncbi:Hypothetical Protein FCC1311_103402 [Hondaea fermentalgiana]|uniref:Uncharacterized protein n=1 Tax=Hondaea fermentalgiana TaxID=2315210 RepID=A0A2R5GTC2_9STRA|nr:Hypothetical Protein FCC1311_103402 [Hondaea fermentalgiana]|eukprot:GBG34117.1 Hypothetical Protein FCC1311_103402 [Hondaea fermentalgiana]
MPFVHPVEVSKNQARYKTLDVCDDFVLQSHRYSLRKKRHPYWVRVITRATKPRFKVAVATSEDRIRAREWKYITEDLILPDPLKDLPVGDETRTSWLLSKISRVKQLLGDHPEASALACSAEDQPGDYEDDEEDEDEEEEEEGEEEEEEDRDEVADEEDDALTTFPRNVGPCNRTRGNKTSTDSPNVEQVLLIDCNEEDDLCQVGLTSGAEDAILAAEEGDDEEEECKEERSRFHSLDSGDSDVFRDVIAKRPGEAGREARYFPEAALLDAHPQQSTLRSQNSSSVGAVDLSPISPAGTQAQTSVNNVKTCKTGDIKFLAKDSSEPPPAASAVPPLASGASEFSADRSQLHKKQESLGSPNMITTMSVPPASEDIASALTSMSVREAEFEVPGAMCEKTLRHRHSSHWMRHSITSLSSIMSGPSEIVAGKPRPSGPIVVDGEQLPTYLTAPDTSDAMCDGRKHDKRESVTMDRLKREHEQRCMVMAAALSTLVALILRFVSFDAFILLLVLLNVAVCWIVQNRHVLVKKMAKSSIKRRVKFTKQIWGARLGVGDKRKDHHAKGQHTPSAGNLECQHKRKLVMCVLHIKHSIL